MNRQRWMRAAGPLLALLALLALLLCSAAAQRLIEPHEPAADRAIDAHPAAPVHARPVAQSRPGSVLSLAAALVLAWAAVALAAHEALRSAWARGPLRQQQTSADFARRLADGHFDSLASPASTGWRDEDFLALRAALRDVHEERARIQGLLAALRASETDRARRDAFDALRQATDADERFADGQLATTAPVAAVPTRSWPRLAVALALAAGAWFLAGWQPW